MEGRRLEGHIRDPDKSRMEETCRRQGRIKPFSEGGQGPSGTAAQWMDGWVLEWLLTGRRDYMEITGTMKWSVFRYLFCIPE